MLGGNRAWIVTPPGTPPRPADDARAQPTYHVPPAPTFDDAPPAYYVAPDITTFDFAIPVAKFLCDIDAGPRALCRIDVIRNYELSSWRGCFREAGLSEAHSEELELLLLDSLTTEQGFVLLAAESVPLFRAPASTASSVGTESTLGDDEETQKI